jgi:hypothetical protein
MKLDNGGLELILDVKQGYSAISYIRAVILNIFNHKDFKDVNLLGITRQLDTEHYELFEDVLRTARVYDISVLNKIACQLLDNESQLQNK